MSGRRALHQIGCRVWIAGEAGPYLGEGRVRLLESVRDAGSISGGAYAMGMSYKKAWRLIQSMNEKAHTPLVNRSAGGQKGGGTTLTEEGERVIQAFKTIKSQCNEFLEQKLAEYRI